jgi:tRNA(Ile)-lysidine synthase
MAARELRYNWFDEILCQNEFKYIATAHHKDDQIETVIINLIRGTGIAGLHGILPKYKNVIHPMMFIWKRDIERYAIESKLSYRTDLSNLSDKYVRNRVRNQILPLFEEINPEYRNSMNETIERLKEVETIFKGSVAENWEKIKKHKDNKIYIPIDYLSQLRPLQTYLFEFISPFGFNSDIVTQIISALEGQSGKIFYSPTHVLVKDREHLVIVKKDFFKQHDEKFILIQKECSAIQSPLNMKFERIKKPDKLQIPVNPEVAFLDYDKLEFPLKIRKWEKGDLFYPLGMTGKKKLSDYFIDKKLSIDQKSDIWLMLSSEDVVWVIGQRIDHRFRITDRTQTIYQITHII